MPFMCDKTGISRAALLRKIWHLSAKFLSTTRKLVPSVHRIRIAAADPAVLRLIAMPGCEAPHKLPKILRFLMF
jgi:hypothetical protein